jgi:glutaminyl-tRNA synthetase
VLDPLPVTVTNYDGAGETLEAPWHPQQPELGTRQLNFGGRLLIDRDDFSDDPPPKYKRLSPGELVRLRYGYIVRCDDVVRDESGRPTELRVSYVPESKSGSDTSGLKPKGVIHWVDAQTAVPARVRRYGPLFTDPVPDAKDLESALNPASLDEASAFVEAAIADSSNVDFQFERLGYFHRDPDDPEMFHRTVTLRDSYKPQKEG